MVRRPSGSRNARRDVRAVAVLPALLFLLLVGGCGNEEAVSTRADSDPPTTSTTSTALDEGNDDANGAKKQPGDKDEKHGNRSGEKPGGAGKAASGEQSDKAGDGDAPSTKGCPGDISPDDCAAIAEAIASDTADDTDNDACPTGISKSECQAAGKAIKAGSGRSDDDSEDECPAGLTQRQCERVAAELGG